MSEETTTPGEPFEFGPIEMLAMSASAAAIHAIAHELLDGFVHEGTENLDEETQEQFNELVELIQALIEASHTQGAVLMSVVSVRMSESMGDEAEAFLASINDGGAEYPE